MKSQIFVCLLPVIAFAGVSFLSIDKSKPLYDATEKLKPKEIFFTVEENKVETIVSPQQSLQTLADIPTLDLKGFNLAFEEMSAMLEDKQPVSFKRAVWLTENAYYNSTLNWTDFNNSITQIKEKIGEVIARKNLGSYKTGANYAIFTYMTDSIPENNNTPCTYDLENFMGEKDFMCFMVSNLLRTKKGNCHSLPYLYKILANEMGAEANLATAPMHVYIKHRDEEGKSWNLELTSGTFSRTSFLIESFNIPEEGIQSGLYMKSLSEKESVVLCMIDLLCYYEKKGGTFSDEFVRKVYTVGLKYSPNSMHLYCKFDDLRIQLEAKMKEKGYTTVKQVKADAELLDLHNEVMETQNKLKEIGYTQLSDKEYKEKVDEITAKKSETK